MDGELHEEILNVGLDLAMEFGEDWLQPIQTRLTILFPALSRDELDAYNELCRKAMFFGHDQVVRSIQEGPSDQAGQFQNFRAAVLAEYPWVADGNLRRLFSQGYYYAMK